MCNDTYVAFAGTGPPVGTTIVDMIANSLY